MRVREKKNRANIIYEFSEPARFFFPLVLLYYFMFNVLQCSYVQPKTVEMTDMTRNYSEYNSTSKLEQAASKQVSFRAFVQNIYLVHFLASI